MKLYTVYSLRMYMKGDNSGPTNIKGDVQNEDIFVI